MILYMEANLLLPKQSCWFFWRLPESTTAVVTYLDAIIILPSFTMVGLCECCRMGVSQSSADEEIDQSRERAENFCLRWNTECLYI